MAKEVLGLIKLQIPAGGANPSPPVGPALGQRGLNIMDFCKAFNDKTKDVEKGAPIPVIITFPLEFKIRLTTLTNWPLSWFIRLFMEFDSLVRTILAISKVFPCFFNYLKFGKKIKH